MYKNTFTLLLFIATFTLNSQTIVWSSDSEDYAGFSLSDNDGDGNNWGIYSGGGEALGFNSGVFFYSASYDNDTGALTPDNILFTPTFAIPTIAKSITFKMKVAAVFTPDFAEKFAVYVYDNDDTNAGGILIYEEVLAQGGAGSAKDITATIPISFAGKNTGIYVRHFDCTNQFQLAVDDFEVSYTTTLSNEDNIAKNISIYPSTVTDIVNINTNKTINKVIITNNLGQRVALINNKQILNQTINLSHLSKGLYFMTIKAENKYQTIRFIKN